MPALGAADFLALSRHVQCVYLSRVPVLSVAQRNEARRLVVLIDALYEARVRLLVAAAAPLDELMAPLLEGGGGGGVVAEAAEIEVGRELGQSHAPRARPEPEPRGPSFGEAPVAYDHGALTPVVAVIVPRARSDGLQVYASGPQPSLEDFVRRMALDSDSL